MKLLLFRRCAISCFITNCILLLKNNNQVQAGEQDYEADVFCDFKTNWSDERAGNRDNDCDQPCDRFGNDTCFSFCPDDDPTLCMKRCSAPDNSKIGPCHSEGTRNKHCDFSCPGGDVRCELLC